jgi:hypothetical protein
LFFSSSFIIGLAILEKSFMNPANPRKLQISEAVIGGIQFSTSFTLLGLPLPSCPNFPPPPIN